MIVIWPVFKEVIKMKKLLNGLFLVILLQPSASPLPFVCGLPAP